MVWRPRSELRQVADLGGAALLTLLLLLANEGIGAGGHALARGWRRWLGPLAIAAALPACMAGYGLWRLSALDAYLAGRRRRSCVSA
jgi:apolipoprotein N-acyltransferase